MKTGAAVNAIDLLSELGRLLGLDLSFDDKGLCVLACTDGLLVEVADLGVARAILLSCELIDAPPVNAAELHKFALEYGHDLSKTRGAAVTLDPLAGGHPELQAMQRLDDLDAARFQTFVGEFINAAREARTAFAKIASGQVQASGGQRPDDLISDFAIRI